MYGDVNVSVEDGNLGKSGSVGIGTQFKIGVSSVTSDVPILITGTMTVKKIIEKLSHCPLADACIDSVEWGANEIYCIPVKADVDGDISEITHTGASTGTVSVDGKPSNEFSILIEVLESGNTNVGTVKYSIDGGYSYTEELTIPTNGKLLLSDTGLTVTFTNTGEEEISFIKGDVYSLSTTSPVMNNSSIISAVEKLININTEFEYVHVVGTTNKAVWAALASLANDFLTKYKKPLFFVCEARTKTSEETLDQYMNAMYQERKGISNFYIQVVLSNATYQRKDGRVQDINMAGLITGLYCQAKESQSIGEVKSFPISSAKLIKLLPDGIEDYIKQFDAMKYTTIRQYIGKEDYYVTSANMMSPETSDFNYAEDVRVLNRLVKAVRSAAINELQTEIDPEDIENSVVVIQEELNTPVEDAKEDKVIASGSVSIDIENLNILVDESLDISITYVPMGHARNMNIKFAVENPYTTA